RLFEVYRTDLRFQVKRPLVWVLVALICFFAWLFSTGHLHVASGDTDVGGKKPWITSMFQQALFTSLFVFLLYGFFVAVAAGMSVIRDDELKVGEVLHGTRMTAAEYVWGKFLSVFTVFGSVLLADVGLRMAFNHLMVSAKAQEFVGP